MDELKQELETYETHKAALLGTDRGKFVLIKGDRVVDTFVSEEDAIKAGYNTFGNVPFLVKEIIEIEVPANFTSYLIAV